MSRYGVCKFHGVAFYFKVEERLERRESPTDLHHLVE